MILYMEYHKVIFLLLLIFILLYIFIKKKNKFILLPIGLLFITILHYIAIIIMKKIYKNAIKKRRKNMDELRKNINYFLNIIDNYNQ